MTTETKDAPRQTLTKAEMEERYLKGLIEQLTEDTSGEFAFADQLLRKIVTENRPPNFSEFTFFKSKLGWSESEVTRQRRRMANVIRNQAIAGRKIDRDALREELETSTFVLESEGPKLDAQIAKLVKQKESLERAASNAQRRTSEVQEALEQLRKPELIRTDILENLNQQRRHFSATHRINELRVELQHRQICLNKPEDMSFEHWIQAIQRLDYSCVRRVVDGQFARYELVEPAWGLRKLELLDEVDAMRDELASLEKEKAAFDESQRLVTEFYVSENE